VRQNPPRIMRILGRTDDMLIIRGINVFPSQVESVLMKIPEVETTGRSWWTARVLWI